MSTKKQHFVPRVYMKAWETQVETNKEPEKKFNGIYVIKDGNKGEGANRKSVLWKPHLYTIKFKYLFICNSCSRVKTQFVDMIYDLLRNQLNPKYLIFIAKGNEGINIVDYRFANSETVKKFNRIINANKNELVISSSRNLNDVI